MVFKLNPIRIAAGAIHKYFERLKIREKLRYYFNLTKQVIIEDSVRPAYMFVVSIVIDSLLPLIEFFFRDVITVSYHIGFYFKRLESITVAELLKLYLVLKKYLIIVNRLVISFILRDIIHLTFYFKLGI